nr:hypothetical protein [Bacteroidota bacterium]
MNFYLGLMVAVAEETPGMASLWETTTDSVKSPYKSSPKQNTKQGTQRNNLSSILRGYKSAVAIQARQINPDFEWQKRFHDHIIRDDQSFNKIREYIRNNPKKWDNDRFNGGDELGM